MKNKRKTLLITNDFPPRAGGIQSFVYELAIRQDPDSLIVFTSQENWAADFDADQPFPVVRHPRYPMLPTRSVRNTAIDLIRTYGCETVWFGALAPLGWLVPALRDAGARHSVALTHGHEAAWAVLPGARQFLRRIARGVDITTYLGEYTKSRLAPVIGDVTDLQWLPPGVDIGRYNSSLDVSAIRDHYGLTDRPVIVCVSRLVPRKGQDTLIRALPAIRDLVPNATLLLVGSGRYESALRRLASRHKVESDVIFTGSVSMSDLPRYYAAGDVFAMPCRTRRGGLDVEGLGIVYLEASACGLPVVAGNSGGAPDAVQDGRTGFVVDGRDLNAAVEKISHLLSHPDESHRMGNAGRAWMKQQWQWDKLSDRMAQMLRT